MVIVANLVACAPFLVAQLNGVVELETLLIKVCYALAYISEGHYSIAYFNWFYVGLVLLVNK